MAQCKYLDGDNVAPRTTAEARKLIGKTVRYLQRRDIDSSGRGYFFPQRGKVANVIRREIAIDHESNFVISMGSLVEMVVIDEPVDAEGSSHADNPT